MNMKNEALKKLEWIEFDSLDELLKEGIYREGVYVIWIETDVGQIALYVGQGNIKQRIDIHNRNEYIVEYYPSVSCAEVNYGEMDGIEKYLSEKLSPLFGERWPNILPTPVNSPFDN